MSRGAETPVLRIFLSSPGDVSDERDLALRVIERVQGWFRGRVVLDPYSWEREPLFATSDFQSQIDRPSQCDLAIFVLWSRLGTPLGKDFDRKTGTEWEFEEARKSHEDQGTPDLLVYRKDGLPSVGMDLQPEEYQNRLEQKGRVEEFFERWFRSEEDGSFTAAFHAFESPAHFGEILEAHLVGWVERKLSGDRPVPMWRGSPYRGLEFFDVEHAPIFFGRTRAIHEMAAHLESQGETRFVLLLGMSGSGKSSLLRAGVLPLLGDDVRPVVVRPSDGPTPLAAWAEALGRPELASSAPSEATGAIQPGHLLIVDQFEELFAVAPDRRDAFVSLLDRLARSGVARVVASLRADFYDRFTADPILYALKNDGIHVDLQPPGAAEIDQIIRQPAQAAGLVFEVHSKTRVPLDRVIEEEALAGPRSLPLLEYALDQLYERRDGNLLTYDAYESLGGVEGSLARRAEEVFSSLAPDVQAALPSVFRMLVDVQGAKATRRTAPAERLARRPEDAAFVEAFAHPKARLFIRDRHADGTAVVTLAHEALLRRWPRMQAWLEEDRELLRVRARVVASASRWRDQGRPPDLLLAPGKPLLESRELRASGIELEEHERAFMAASEMRARRGRRLKRAVVVVIALLAVGAGVLWIRALRAEGRASARAVEAERERRRADDRAADASREKGRADRRAAEARRSLGLAYWEQGQREQQRSHLRALVYLSKAYELLADSESRDLWALRYLLATSMPTVDAIRLRIRTEGAVDLARFGPAEKRLLTSGKRVEIWDAATGRRLIDVEGGRAAVFSPDGKRILVASGKAAVLWDAATGKRLAAFGETEYPINDVDFSSDGKLLVAADNRGVARVWSVEDRTLVSTLTLGDSLATARFDSRGERVLAIGKDGRAAIWSARSGKVIQAVYHGSQFPDSAHFSPDGERFLTAASAVDVWSVETGKRIAQLKRPQHILTSAAFSPDGKRVAACGSKGTATLWDVESGKLIRPFQGHTDFVSSISFSPDGRRVVTAGRDTTVRVWDAETGQLLQLFEGHRAPVASAVFDASGDRILSAGWDGEIRIWRLPEDNLPPDLRGHQALIHAVAFDADGDRAVTASADKTARLWDVRTGKTLGVLRHEDVVIKAGFSPDGNRVFTTSGDKTARIWDPKESRLLHTLKGHERAVDAASFSPDGKLFVTQAQNARVWDVATGELLQTLELPVATEEDDFAGTMTIIGPRTASFGPESRRVITTSLDRVARIWEARSGNKLRVLRGHEGAILWGQISPDGRHAATTARDMKLRLWDATGDEPVAVFKHPNDILHAVFSPDGSFVVTGCQDKRVRVWSVKHRRLAAQFEGHTDWVSSLSVGPQSRQILTASHDETVAVWDVRSGRLVSMFMHRAPQVRNFNPLPQLAAALSPDGTRLITTIRDQTAFVWEMPREHRSPAEIAALVREHVPYRLEEDRLIPTR